MWRQKIKNSLTLLGEFFKHPQHLRYLSVIFKNPIDSGLPWLSIEAKEWLDKNVSRDGVVFEYGAGGSTLYLAGRCKQIISVEHDYDWLQVVAKAMTKFGVDNVKLLHRHPESTDYADDYRSSDVGYSGQQFKKYVHAIDDFSDQYFDLVIIDGRCRVACAKQAIKKVKPGGYILLDNSDRSEYAEVLSLLSGYQAKQLVGVSFGTIIKQQSTVWQIV